jgi:hypothetical protein
MIILNSQRWTPEEDNILIAYYRKGNVQKIISDIRDKTGKSRTIPSIRCRAAHLGVSSYFGIQRKPWTKNDDEKFLEVYPNLSMSTLCRMFGRGRRAIYQRARHLGVTRQDRFDCYTQFEVCNILGIGEPKLKYFINNGLKARKLDSRTTVIDTKDLRDFLIKHSMEISDRMFHVVNILVGDKIS